MSQGGTRILGDWGSTRLRLWLLVGDAVQRSFEAPGLFAPDTIPTRTLAAALAELDPAGRAARVVLCGMAGARGGLAEAPYAACPAGAADWARQAVQAEAASRPITVLPGLTCRNAAGVADVMRGEEAQVFGALSLDPALAEGDWTLVLPGTHSKWVSLCNGQITSFATCLTGELFARLEPSSLLGGARLEPGGDGTEAEGFAAGLAARDRPGALGTLLFAGRTARLCDGRSLDWARGYVSGLLIADEVAQAPVGEIVVIGDGALARRYGEAIGRRGGRVRTLDGDACVRRGLEIGDAGA